MLVIFRLLSTLLYLNANDRSMRLGLVVGVRVLCYGNMAFSGDFEPVLAKHSRHLDLNSALAILLESMQRNFKPMADRITNWRGAQITDGNAKEVIYRAFIGEQLEAPKHLARFVHAEYFNPTLPDFAPRTQWSLQNASSLGGIFCALTSSGALADLELS